MAKPKSPLLSLGATGTIGDALTYQKRGQDTITRKKPIPAYRYTLAQAYQRWLYYDYAYLWTQQSAATQRQYAADGSRFHLTGFQYWMKYQLTNLPDIAAWWKLDDNIGATTIDSSRNGNTGTIFGASPATGIINGCLSFDGLNDYLDCGNHISLNLTQAVTIIAWVNIHDASTNDNPLVQKAQTHASYGLLYHGLIQVMRFYITGASLKIADAAMTPAEVENKWIHVGCTYDRVNLRIYIDGVLKTSIACTDEITTSPLNLQINGDSVLGRYTEGNIDEVRIYNRALDPTEVKRHYERSYP